MWTAGAAGLLEEPSQFFLAVHCQNGLVTSHHHITEEESAFRVVLIQELQELQALAFQSIYNPCIKSYTTAQPQSPQFHEDRRPTLFSCSKHHDSLFLTACSMTNHNGKLHETAFHHLPDSSFNQTTVNNHRITKQDSFYIWKTMQIICDIFAS